MKLPFLKHSNWPTSEEPGEKVVNPSYDKQLQDHLIQKILIALEKKHYGSLKEALVSLIHSIQLEEV